MRLVGQLARLAHRHEADAEPLGQRRAEDEAARLDADDELGLVRRDALGEQIGHEAERRPVAEQRRDVLEEDARAWESRARRGCAR